MAISSFSEIEAEFNERVNKSVWCNVGTVDTHNRPRSRIMHPVWEGPVGWVTFRPGTPKVKHLAANPYVSLAYVSDVAKPVYADCKAEICTDPAERQRVWEYTKSLPAPMGYDLGAIYAAPDDPGFGLLKLTPWRISIVTFPSPPQIWYQDV
jgi:general stress protein 26